jgi:hypothetical protein
MVLEEIVVHPVEVMVDEEETQEAALLVVAILRAEIHLEVIPRGVILLGATLPVMTLLGGGLASQSQVATSKIYFID